MATWAELAKIKHHAVRSDGAKFLDGVRDDSLDTSWLSVNSAGRVTLGPGLYDELLVVKGEVTDDQIKTWASMGAPFYDPSPVVQENQIPAAENWNRKVMTFYQATAPTATTIGDMWYDTSDDNKPRRWNGTTWVDVADMTPIDASKRPVSVQGAGGRFEIDRYGERAIRSSDGKVMRSFDIETGEQYFAGHVEAESGYFRGRVEANEGFFKGDITGASGTFSGELAAKSITADMYAEIRNTMPYVGLSSLDSSKPIVIPIYIPSETVNIAGAFLSAEARRYRAYAKSAPQRTNPWLTSTANVRDTVHSPQIELKTDWDDTIYLENANYHYHSFDFTHDHELEFGIHEDTSPNNVKLRINNGSSWSGYINLASAPNTTSPYDLISSASVPKYNNSSSEMDLTSYLSGSGWKYLEFSSSRLGMIAWNIILKLDITA